MNQPPNQTANQPAKGIRASERPRPVVLSIAGFDPSAGAGVAADLKVFAAHGLYGMACVTALTVQSTLGVRRVEALDPLTVRDTLQALGDDVSFAGIKIGMLSTERVVREVASFLAVGRGSGRIAILDPVLRSSSGRELLEPAGVAALQRDLLPLVDWIAPNLDELAVLTGRPVARKEHVSEAAKFLKNMVKLAGNPRLAVLVTGGHLDPPDDFLLTADGEACWFSGERVETSSTHGTGCALSSALLCRLVRGDLPREAAANAKAYVAQALEKAYPIGKGHGPMNHLFRLPQG